MESLKSPGVYTAAHSDGSLYYRASLTHKGKHISLGSFETQAEAARAYEVADRILRDRPDGSIESSAPQIHDFDELGAPLDFKKWVMLINLRDNGLYCNGPIYLRSRYFEYYLDLNTVLRFGADELFYYTHHTIQRRGSYLFVADYGMQTGIKERYGIRPFAVPGRDYYYKNGDEFDYRSGNVVIVNRYNGVRKDSYRGKKVYTARIHVDGDLVVGRYDSEDEAAIAYNKAADMLQAAGLDTDYRRNYIEDLSETEYKLMYRSVRVLGRFRRYCEGLKS